MKVIYINDSPLVYITMKPNPLFCRIEPEVKKGVLLVLFKRDENEKWFGIVSIGKDETIYASSDNIVWDKLDSYIHENTILASFDPEKPVPTATINTGKEKEL